MAWSDVRPTSDGTPTVPPPVEAMATPPATSASSTATATNAPTNRRVRGARPDPHDRRSRRSAAWGRVLVEERGRSPDLRGIDEVDLATEAGERERGGRRQRARGVGERLAHRGGVGIALVGIGPAGALDDRTEAAELQAAPPSGVCVRTASVPIAVSATAGTVPVTASDSTTASE